MKMKHALLIVKTRERSKLSLYASLYSIRAEVGSLSIFFHYIVGHYWLIHLRFYQLRKSYRDFVSKPQG